MTSNSTNSSYLPNQNFELLVLQLLYRDAVRHSFVKHKLYIEGKHCYIEQVVHTLLLGVPAQSLELALILVRFINGVRSTWHPSRRLGFIVALTNVFMQLTHCGKTSP